MSKDECISSMSDYLFWDIDKDILDLDKSYIYIIQRVLEFGQWHDWVLIRKYYGLDKIVEACKKMRSLDSRALSYICNISNTNREEYRCYTPIH